MEQKNDDHKIILECNKQGIVSKVFLDSSSLLENLELPIGLHSIVSPSSMQELGSFWLSIQENSMEENTLLTLSYNEKQTTYIFSGYLLKDKVLLCGNTALTSTEKVLEEIMLINNEQANKIRLNEKKAGNLLKKAEKRASNEALLNDFTSLNNELINSKRELMRKNQKIELLNKALNDANENLTMFTYSVSHDLKEPVRMTKSFLTLLNQKYRDILDQRGQTYLDMASEGANRLSKMLADLQLYHQSSIISTTDSVDLNDVIQEVKKILQKQINEKNALVTCEKLPVLKGSSTGFIQVFQNLISNAIKFVPEERTPVVSIELEDCDTAYIILVKDNGIGIPENQKQEVFNLFKRLHAPKEYKGTGVGLAMVKKTIERMGGTVWLESEVGKGSTFYISIGKSGEV